MIDTPSVLVAKGAIAVVLEETIERLKKMAVQTPLKRARLCLHRSHEDPVQEMVIVLHRDSYIRPHRHQHKTESFHMIEGEVVIGFFNDGGDIQSTLRLSASERYLYRLSAPLWHTVVPLTEFAVFHEVSTGPFIQSEYPFWEPGVEMAQDFKDKVVSFR